MKRPTTDILGGWREWTGAASRLADRVRTPVLLASAIAALFSACAANVDHHQLGDDSKETGIRYYDSAPYLLVYSDGKGGLWWQILYLPDQSRIMVASPQVLGGHTETTMSFSNGVLGTTSTIGDTTAIPKALISAVQTALPLIAAGAAANARAGFPSPYLYKLVVSDGQLTFLGEQGKVVDTTNAVNAIAIQTPYVTQASNASQ